MNLAELERAGRRWAAAIRHAREAAEVYDRAGHPRGRGMALSVLAMAALRGGTGGDLGVATEAIAAATALLPTFGDDRPMRAIVQARRSVILHACGRTDEVYAALAGAVEGMAGTVAQFEIPPFIDAHAALLARQDAVAAARLLGLADAVRDNQEHPQPPLLQPPARTADVCRKRLGPAGYATAYRFGAALYRHGLPDALAEVLAAPTGGGRELSG